MAVALLIVKVILTWLLLCAVMTFWCLGFLISMAGAGCYFLCCAGTDIYRRYLK